MTNAAAIIATARKYMGVPYKYKGRDPQRGLDCMGLPVCIAHDLGWTTLDYARYGNKADWAMLYRLVKEAGLTMIGKRRDDLRPGVLAVFNVYGQPHGAIIADGSTPLSMIHAYQRSGKVVEHRVTGEWLRRLRSVWVREEA